MPGSCYRFLSKATAPRGRSGVLLLLLLCLPGGPFDAYVDGEKRCAATRS